MPPIDPQSFPIICLLGPTASGKSQLAMQLASSFPIPMQIVSVDSAMIYRGMDIGTAKPSAQELASVPHHLIDICDPSEAYSAGRFRQDALNAIDIIHQQHAIPLLVGGTMLYFAVLQRGIADLPTANAEVRQQLILQAQQEGWTKLHLQLQQVDPDAAAKINPQDKQRIQRALEVYMLTGQTISALQQQKQELPYPIINIAIAPQQRDILHERIAQRLEIMFNHGLVEEVRLLYNRADIHADLPAMRTVGYRQVWQYLAGEYDYPTLRQRTIFATRQLAKRQFTWLRSWPNITWFDSESDNLLIEVTAYLNLKSQSMME